MCTDGGETIHDNFPRTDLKIPIRETCCLLGIWLTERLGVIAFSCNDRAQPLRALAVHHTAKSILGWQTKNLIIVSLLWSQPR
jgi:hypothetical protein